MANPFQSMPSYGSTPYGSASYYPQYQQYGAQQPAHSPSSYSPHGMAPMGGFQPSPNVNMGRVDANAQMPSTKRFPFPPPSFTPDMLKHFANSNVPPPPPPPPGFPPVPLPNLGMPQFPHTFPHTNTPPFHQPSNSNHIEDPDAYDPRYPSNIISARWPDKEAHNSSNTYAPAVQQETEPQEDDSPSSRTISHEDRLPQPVDSQNERDHPANLDGSAFSSQKVPILPIVEPRSSQATSDVNLDTAQPTASHTKARDVSQRESSSPLATAGQNNANTFHPRGDSQHQPTSIVKSFHRHYENKTAAELHQLAKGALLSLAPHNIHYADLVDEGVDARVLTVLYEELGIRVPPQRIVDQSDNASTLLIRPEDPVSVQVSAPSVQLQPPASGQSNTSGSDRPAPAISPGLERKDRIAQLLAAKAGRASPAHSISDSLVSAGPLDAPNLLSTVGAVKATAVEPGTTHSTTDKQEAGPQPTLSSQTENLRDSLENLREEPLIKTQLERRSTDGGALPSPFSSSIPGLFMTVDDRMQLENAATNATASSLAHGLRVASTSQKRRRSSGEQDLDVEPLPKRQNTTSDLDEGEVMVIDSPSVDDISEGEITDDEPAVLAAPPVHAPAEVRVVQLQRSHSATEVPTIAAGAQSVNNVVASGTASASQPKPFGSTAVTGMTAAQISERAEMLKARFLKQRAERQKALQDGLPNLDAEVTKTQTLLAEKQSSLPQFDEQIQKLKTELVAIEQAKQAALEEVSSLERQLQDGISGQRQYNAELQKLSTDHNGPKVGKRILESSDAPASLTVATPAAGASEQITGETIHNRLIEGEMDSDNIMENTQQDPATPSANHNSHPESAEGGPEIFEVAPDHIDTTDNEPVHEVANHEKADLQDSTQAGADRTDTVNGSWPESTESPDLPTSPVVSEDMKGVEMIHEDDSDGSASMSDSGSDEDEYEPADPATTYPMDIYDNASDEYDPEEAPVEPTPPAAPIDVHEDYEPAENITMEEALTQANDVVTEEPKIDSGSAPSNGHEPQKTITSTSTPQLDGLIHSVPLDASITMPSPQRPRSTPRLSRPLTNEGAGHKVEFAPYQSPLSNLKSFRYNQHFNESAKEGFRSLTYSNTIDPNVPLCQTELTGDVCQNSGCEEQHFRKLQLTDDQILVQMSNTSDIQDKGTRDMFTKGLKGLIADLRSRNVKEFENVAKELSIYRRRFFAERELI